MEEKLKIPNPDDCLCKKIPQLAHDLNQSLLIIYSYTQGCSERIKQNNLNLEQLILTFEKINKQIQIMGHKIHHINA